MWSSSFRYRYQVIITHTHPSRRDNKCPPWLFASGVGVAHANDDDDDDDDVPCSVSDYFFSWAFLQHATRASNCFHFVCVCCMFFLNVVAASYLLLNEAICLLSLCCEALKHFRFIFSSLEKLFFHCRTARKLGVVAGVRRWKGRKVAYRSYSLGLKWLGFFGTSSAAQVVLSGWAAQR